MLVTLVGKFWESVFKAFSNNHEYVVLVHRYNMLVAFLMVFSLAISGIAVAANVRLQRHPDKPISLELPSGRENEDIQVRKKRLSRLLEAQ